MSTVFLKAVNLSIKAGWLILAVILVRFLFGKAPKRIHCILWALVALRLICPFAWESSLSLIPSRETVPGNIEMMENPAIDSGIRLINETVNPVIADRFTPDPLSSANPLQLLLPVLSLLWIAGIAGMLLYALISYIRLKKSVGASIPFAGNVFACDEVPSPFLLGVLHPLIYVPSSLEGEALEYVITHERAHIRRGDHWWKPLGFLLLTVYWFNPLCWVAYILLCRDIEMACDERVIRSMDNAGRAAYSQALLDCSFSRRTVSICPLAFGEAGVKERVKSILHYKNPARWIVIAAVAVCLAAAVCFLTNPKAYNLYDIKSAIVAVCHYEDLGEDTGFGKYMDTQLAQSLMDSISPRRNIDKAYYGVKTKLLKKETSPRGIEMTYQVIRKFRYENADFDTTISEEVHIVYDSGRKRITDFRFLYPNR